MGGINLSVHPLFFAFGLYYALTGKIFIFVIYTVCAVVHEFGHSFQAANAGYKLNKITLMPFGAVVSGNIDGLHFKDEIKIALAGPLLNLAIGLFFVATWWLFPETYAFTDVVAEANFSLALVNFLPIFPLDGGRVLSASLVGAFGKRKAEIICKITGGVFSVILFVLFIISAFNEFNLSLLFFSLFVLFGAFGKNRDNKYVRLYSALSEERLKRGVAIKRQAVYKTVTVKKLMSMLDDTAVNEIVVFDGENQRTTLTQKRIGEILEKGDLYSPIEKYI
ncbi:MAG: hypothetical protein IJX03_02165 [Clostridia bacterium]|nr:hypothetical protein [Clostridia bacterium]